MKRIWILGLALAMVSGLALFAFGDDEEDYRGGPGMMGPGMMGFGGAGMMGPGMMGWGWDADLDKEQADKLEQIQFNTMRAMRGMMYDNRERMIAMHKAMRAFPVDEKAALEQWKAMNQVREAMFKLHLSALSQSQQAIGQEKWEELMKNSDGPGSGRGGPGMMRNR